MFGTEFAADKGVDVLNQLRIELIGLSLTLFDSPALPLGFFGAVLLPLGAVPSDFAADGAFVAVKLFGDFGDGAVAGQVLDVVSFALGQLRVAHGNLSCRKGRMLPHTGLFLLGKVALQMRIRRRLKTFFRRHICLNGFGQLAEQLDFFVFLFQHFFAVFQLHF
ncbi:putative phage associated protein [Neisseria meningitidis]|uniref:Putative phage associated protein n=1 Tax=Neisseria meningitidis TaxID=487 RepID=A0A378VUW4_NEIME|nr:putative phage associated protein [Neisseria meningitidis]